MIEWLVLACKVVVVFGAAVVFLFWLVMFGKLGRHK